MLWSKLKQKVAENDNNKSTTKINTSTPKLYFSIEREHLFMVYLVGTDAVEAYRQVGGSCMRQVS